MKLGRRMWVAICLLWLSSAAWVVAFEYDITLEPVMRVVDLDVGEQAAVSLSNGETASVELVAVAERRDSIRHALREAVATVIVNGETVRIVSATYQLPRKVAGVQIDCPVTSGYTEGSLHDNVWGLEKTARFRLWPAASSWIDDDTFRYPARPPQRSGTSVMER